MIARGPQSSVWRAEDTVLNRTVALRILEGNEPFDSYNFRAAARAAARLNHPNIAAVLDVASADEVPWVSVEYIPSTISHSDDVDLVQAGISICEALEHAASVGIEHGSVKESNIGITDGGTVRVMDFGLAKISSDKDALLQMIYRLAAKRGVSLRFQGDSIGAIRKSLLALLPAVAESRPAVKPRRERKGRFSFLRSEGKWLLVIGLIIAVGAAIVRYSPSVREAVTDLIPRPSPAPAAVSAGGIYDPPPGDGSENDGLLMAAFDGNEETGWKTSSYKTEAFGNLKRGVGIWADMGEGGGTTLEVVSEKAGWEGTLRTSADAVSWSNPTESVKASKTQVLRASASSRYLMLWITKLAMSDDSDSNPYTVVILEIRR